MDETSTNYTPRYSALHHELAEEIKQEFESANGTAGQLLFVFSDDDKLHIRAAQLDNGWPDAYIIGLRVKDGGLHVLVAQYDEHCSEEADPYWESNLYNFEARELEYLLTIIKQHPIKNVPPVNAADEDSETFTGWVINNDNE